MAAKHKTNGNRNHASLVGHNQPADQNVAHPLWDISGNVAAHKCQECGNPYVVSCYNHRYYHSTWQAYRVCPHCCGTEAVIWFEGYTDKGRTQYRSDQRVIPLDERQLIRKGDTTAIEGNYRAVHTRENVERFRKWD